MTSPARKLSHSLRISIDDVRLGMFISELDRPWSKTPFLIQGFQLVEELDLQTLHSLVQEVVIDPSRSDLASIAHLPWDLLHETPPEVVVKPKRKESPQVYYTEVNQEEKRKTPLERINAFFGGVVDFFHFNKAETRPYYLRHADADDEHDDSKADRATRLAPPSEPGFSHLIQSLYPRDVHFLPLNWIERWQHWQQERNLDKPHRRGRNVRKLPPNAPRPDYIPDNIKLVKYEDFTPIQKEIDYARNIIERADVLIKKLESDIHDDQSIALEQVGPAVNLLTASVISNPSALMWLIRMRTENTIAYAHCLKVAIYMMVLGRHLGFPRNQLNELGYIGLLLDVGKLELPQEILQKPDKLSDEEYQLMRTHVTGSIKILEAKDPLAHNVMLGISEHHERLDGSGYPKGLVGNQISIFGRIAAIADSFAAMTSKRPYDITRSPFDAMKELFREAGTQLHAPLVEEFVQAIGIFPVGSMIELSTGEVAIVLEHNKVRRLEPKVLLLTNGEKELLERPSIIDLMQQRHSDHSRKILRGLPDGAYGLVCRDFYQGQ